MRDGTGSSWGGSVFVTWPNRAISIVSEFNHQLNRLGTEWSLERALVIIWPPVMASLGGAEITAVSSMTPCIMEASIPHQFNSIQLQFQLQFLPVMFICSLAITRSLLPLELG